MYQPRDYRKSFTDRLKWYNVCVEETDLMIGTDEDCSELVLKTVRTLRKEIYAAIRDNSEFLTSLVPVEYKGEGVVEAMVEAAKLAEVGPFAAVAGAINDMLAEKLMDKSKQIIIENGGDIYIKSDQDRLIGIYAGNSVLSGKFAIEIQKDLFPVGVCTSSATVGHSFSMGKADAAVVISKTCAVADAFATAFCNRIKKTEDIAPALEWVNGFDEVIGAVAIINDKIGAIGNIKLVKWN
ncbi:MAG TPA: UPF0280 family protein [Clostridia bacterium]|jgi:ApbE superfamily uncharacterized protein (UPF0280 family)|nr:UPF0280 family protein [Clostridiaceae bacterium]HOF26614.1 UPF0280 family protein [Clostridia bacterium]HOM34307.1 UPF0280 family protein [Clostridia bacterium]HOR89388.1 UPF0280 family protein [Clostridia bacterium]HOT70803.1 UPF0280 family protein [Clostridia bacterium]